MENLIKNTITKTYCLRHCCQGTPKRAVHGEGGAVSINTKVKSEDTEITDTRNHRHSVRKSQVLFLLTHRLTFSGIPSEYPFPGHVSSDNLHTI